MSNSFKTIGSSTGLFAVSPPAQPKPTPTDDPANADPLLPAIQKWQEKRDPAQAAIMLQHLRPVFDKAFRKYVPGQDTTLLRAEAKRIALDALPGFQPGKGHPEAFLLPHLQRLQRLAVQHNNIISVPERVLLARQALHRAETELLDETGYMPSTQALADYTGLTLKQIQHARRAQLPLAEGQAVLMDEDGEPQEPTVEQPPTHAAALFVYDSLDDERDQLILELGLGLHGRRKLRTADIAERLHITPAAVSQRAAKIQQQIDEIERAGLF